jgi:CheY-like chemotaxis protein
MQWLGPEIAARYESSRWPVLLSVCPDIDRMQNREHALHSAGYVVASASTLFAAEQMCHLCSFDLVLLDRECAPDDEAADLLQRYPSILVEHGMTELQLLSKLREALQIERASAAVH